MPDLRIDSVTIKADAADAQQVIDRQLAVIRNDAKVALDTEKARADKAATDLAAATKRADGLLARGRAIVTRARKRLDAMKAKMIGCDECGGTGKVDEAKCDYCDGVGAVRMHDAIKAMAPDPDGDNDMPMDDDMEAMGEEMPEDAMETPDGPAVDPAKQEKGKMDARKAAAKVAQQKRRDSLNRMADRRAKVRAALLTEAGKHVDAADIKDKPDAEIKRAVLAKIAPHLDAKTLDGALLDSHYGAELKRMDANGAAPSLAVAGGMFPAGPRADAARNADHQKAVEAARAAMRPWEKPAGYTSNVKE